MFCHPNALISTGSAFVVIASDGYVRPTAHRAHAHTTETALESCVRITRGAARARVTVSR
eukprot:2031794-Prymnesium_polylepis.1